MTFRLSASKASDVTQAAQAAARGAGGAAPAAGGGRSGQPQVYAGSYPESLVKDVIPFVEKRDRALTDKDNRAIAGLSMGGGHTLLATNKNPGVFEGKRPVLVWIHGGFTSGSSNELRMYELQSRGSAHQSYRCVADER